MKTKTTQTSITFKTFVTLIAFLTLITFSAFAQSGGVVISTNPDAKSDPSAILDIQDTTKGLLIPRMTTEQMLNIQPKATGLLVYNNDDNHFYYYDGKRWQRINQWTYDTTANCVYYIVSNGDTAVTITDNGYVGIGTTSPAAPLFVQTTPDIAASYFDKGIMKLSDGNLVFKVFIGTTISGRTNSDGIIYVEAPGKEDFMFGGNAIPDGDNAQYLGVSIKRWKAVYAANGTIQTSDERDKKGIKGLDYGLDQVMQLRPVSYYWKDDSVFTGRKIGFVAQDMEKVIPEVVVKPGGKGGHYGIIYTDLIPVLTKAIQEQQKQISTQQKQIDLLQQQVTELKKQNDLLLKLLNQQDKQH